MELKRAAVGTYVKTTAGIVGKIAVLGNGFIVVACADQGLSSVNVKREDLTKSSKHEFDKVRNQPPEMVKLRQMAEEERAELGEAEEQEEAGVIAEIEAELEEPKTKRNGLLDPEATEKYVVCVTSSGRKSKHKGDPVSVMLEGKSIDEVYQTVSELAQIPEQTLRAKWVHLNNGMQRMNAGNFLRRSLRTR